MNPRDFLDLANELAGGSTEAEWRTGVSRAYYAAFHVARQLLTRCGFAVPRAEQAHGYLWLRLCNAGHVDVGKAGGDLGRLRSFRNAADYDIDKSFDPQLGSTCVLLATDIVQVLEDAAALPLVLARITAARRDYERDILKHVTWHP
ncbi:MAG: HEPN domain-containing protein [Gemmataceae bacterium]